MSPLGPVVGSGQGLTRPVLVVSQITLNDILPVVNVLPITSRKAGHRIYPNEALPPTGTAGLTLESIVSCCRIRTLDKRRLGRALGSPDNETLRQAITDALTFQLDLM